MLSISGAGLKHLFPQFTRSRLGYLRTLEQQIKCRIAVSEFNINTCMPAELSTGYCTNEYISFKCVGAMKCRELKDASEYCCGHTVGDVRSGPWRESFDGNPDTGWGKSKTAGRNVCVLLMENATFDNSVQSVYHSIGQWIWKECYVNAGRQSKNDQGIGVADVVNGRKYRPRETERRLVST